MDVLHASLADEVGVAIVWLAARCLIDGSLICIPAEATEELPVSHLVEAAGV